MTTRLAFNKDSEHIFKIWYACFTDDKAYIMNYLKYCLPHTKTWVLEVENGEIVSCLSIIPSYFVLNSKIIRGGYLYAVGTLPEHRGNSYSKILIESAISDCQKNGLSYLLVKPATESLYNLYSRASFESTLYKSTTIHYVKHTNLIACNQITISPTDASELYSLRQNSFAGTYFLWPEKILEYVIIEALSRSGSCNKIEIVANKSCNLLYYIAYPTVVNKKRIYVLETNARNRIEIEYLKSSIISEYPGTEEIEIESSSDSPLKDNNIVSRSALCHTFDKELTGNIEKLHLSLPLE
ncbi:MAG: GNAT family N-acetyltransferase [Bacteroidales bacterium]|jgi:GNAT superfamily N-acetyltransferase